MADQIEGLPEGATIGPSLQTQVEGLPEGATVGPSLTQTTPAATAQPAEKPSKIYDLWETANKPLLEQPKIEKRATEYAQAPPTLAESEHPYLTAAKKFGAGVVGSTEKMARDFSSPLGIATMAAGPIVEAAGEAAPATKALVTEAAPYLSSLAKYGKGALGTLFGTQGAIEAGKGIQQISKEGLTPEAAEQTLSGAGQAAMGATMGLHGTEMGEAPAQKTLMAPVRGAAKLATPMSHIIPSVGGMIGAAELGIPHPWIVGGSLGRFVLPPEYLQRLFERGRTAGLSAEEANIVHLQDRYNEALKDAEQPRKAYEAHEAGRQQGIPAPQDVLDAHQKAQTALQTAEAHLHAAEQDYVNKAKTAPATTGPMELSPEQQAAQAERMTPPPTNEKLGARQEKLMADIEAKAPPYAEGTEPFPRMGEKQPGMTAGEPEVPAAKAEAPPVMTAGKPERAPSMAGLKVTPEGKAIDTTAVQTAAKEALGAEKPARMVPATEGVAVKSGEVPPMKGEYTELTGKRLGVPPPITEDIGAKVRGEDPPLPRGERREAVRTPEQEQTTRLFKQARTELGENASSDDVMARVNALKEAEAKGIPAKEPGLMGAEKELKAEGRSPEDQSKAEEAVNDLRNQSLQNLGARFGLSTKTEDYDFSKREGEKRHTVDRDRFHKDLMGKLPADLVDQLAASAKEWDEKNPHTFDQPSRSNKWRADRAEAITKDALTKYQDALAAKGQGGGAPESAVEEPKAEAEKPKEEPKAEKHTYEFSETGDIRQVHARDSEGKSVALVSAMAEENDPRLWTVRYSGAAKVGQGIGEKAYMRLAEAARAESNRSEKPITIQGDDELSSAAKRTWEKLETNRGYDVRWKDGRPSITFQPEEE